MNQGYLILLYADDDNRIELDENAYQNSDDYINASYISVSICMIST